MEIHTHIPVGSLADSYRIHVGFLKDCGIGVVIDDGNYDEDEHCPWIVRMLDHCGQFHGLPLKSVII